MQLLPEYVAAGVNRPHMAVDPIQPKPENTFTFGLWTVVNVGMADSIIRGGNQCTG